MLWHLCNPDGASQRTTYASDVSEARQNFRLVRDGWFIASDASYRMGWSKSEAPQLCVKCFRNRPADGNKKCDGCRTRDRASTNRVNAKKPRNRTEERRKTAIANGTRASQGNILRGIERRRAKREGAQ